MEGERGEGMERRGEEQGGGVERGLDDGEGTRSMPLLL